MKAFSSIERTAVWRTWQRDDVPGTVEPMFSLPRITTVAFAAVLLSSCGQLEQTISDAGSGSSDRVAAANAVGEGIRVPQGLTSVDDLRSVLDHYVGDVVWENTFVGGDGATVSDIVERHADGTWYQETRSVAADGVSSTFKVLVTADASMYVHDSQDATGSEWRKDPLSSQVVTPVSALIAATGFTQVEDTAGGYRISGSFDDRTATRVPGVEGPDVIEVVVGEGRLLKEVRTVSAGRNVSVAVFSYPQTLPERKAPEQYVDRMVEDAATAVSTVQRAVVVVENLLDKMALPDVTSNLVAAAGGDLSPLVAIEQSSSPYTPGFANDGDVIELVVSGGGTCFRATMTEGRPVVFSETSDGFRNEFGYLCTTRVVDAHVSVFGLSSEADD